MTTKAEMKKVLDILESKGQQNTNLYKLALKAFNKVSEVEQVMGEVIRIDNGLFEVVGTDLYIANVHGGFGGGNNKYCIFRKTEGDAPSEKLNHPTSLQRCKKMVRNFIQ